MNWQPIETAPRDGTTVQLMNIHNGYKDIGHYCDYSKERWLHTLDGEWSTKYGNGDMTHWMPLPEPPEVSK